ncbi:MAG: tetratricopeptide repeat protein [Acidobacteriota bacterium]|nr:tetratricopeptide repeat protein [Acidobacteriota bacterium]
MEETDGPAAGGGHGAGYWEPWTTGRGAIVWVAAALFLLFTFISILNNAYHHTRRNRAEARYLEGLRLAGAGRNQEAEEDFRAALVYEHDDPKYRLALSQSLVSLGRWDEAGSHLLELQQGDPTNGPINQMLARIAVRAGRSAEAIQDYNRAIYGYWPEDGEQSRIAARMELIRVLDARGQQKQVLAELLALAGEAPDNDLPLRRGIGEMLLAHHSPQHAAETYRGILAAHPRDAASERGLGEAEFEMGDFVAARNAFRAAARRGPADPALAQRIALTDDILALDPTLVRLTMSQRYERAGQILRRTLASANACTAVPQDLAGSAEKILGARPQRMREGETAGALTLSQELWSLRQNACARTPEADQALAAVMTKIGKQ